MITQDDIDACYGAEGLDAIANQLLKERDAYREITQYRCEECMCQNFSYPTVDAEARRILEERV